MCKGSLIRGVTRQDIPEYPEVALREAIVNAVAHRDYSHFVRGSHIQVRMFADRLEVENPGWLYGGVTVDELKDLGELADNPGPAAGEATGCAGRGRRRAEIRAGLGKVFAA
jgi:hypothetical protein